MSREMMETCSHCGEPPDDAGLYHCRHHKDLGPARPITISPGGPIKGKSGHLIVIIETPKWTWMDAFGTVSNPKPPVFRPVKSGRLPIWNPESECVVWLSWPLTKMAGRHEPSLAPAVNPERREGRYQHEILMDMFPRCKTNRGRLKRLHQEVLRKKARTA